MFLKFRVASNPSVVSFGRLNQRPDWVQDVARCMMWFNHVIMSSCHHVIMSSCHHVIMTSWHHDIMSSWHHDIMLSCHMSEIFAPLQSRVLLLKIVILRHIAPMLSWNITYCQSFCVCISFVFLYKLARAARKIFEYTIDFHDFSYEILCVEKIRSRPRENLCVDEIGSRPHSNLCVDKIGSRPREIFVFAHLLFENWPMITFPIVHEKNINAKRISLL